MQQSATAIRTYRLYFRDGRSVLWQSHEVDLSSDDDARELATKMLWGRAAYACTEVWDRARHVYTVRRDCLAPALWDHRARTSRSPQYDARGLAGHVRLR
jgi:hypothetical protein